MALVGLFAALSETRPVASEDLPPGAKLARDAAQRAVGGEGALASTQPEVSLEVQSGKNLVSALLGFAFGSASNQTLDLKLSGPLEDPEGEVTLAGLGDLPSGNAASLSYSVAWKSRSLKGALNRTDQCRELNEMLGAFVLPSSAPAAAATLAARQAVGSERLAKAILAADFARDALDAYVVELNRPGSCDELKGAVRRACEDKLLARSRFADRELLSGSDRLNLALANSCKKLNTTLPLSEQLYLETPGRDGFNEGVASRMKASGRLCDEESVVAATRAAAIAKAVHQAQVELSAAENAAATPSCASDPVCKELLENATKKHREATSQISLATASEAAALKAYEELADDILSQLDLETGVNLPFLRDQPIQPSSTNVSCSTAEVDAILTGLGREDRWAFQKRLIETAPRQYFLTFNGSGSSQDFKYFPLPPTINSETILVQTKKDREYHRSYRAGFSILQSGTLWTVGYSFKTIWKPGPQAEFCSPAGSEGVVRCSAGAAGAPKSSEIEIADLQWKRQVTDKVALQAQAFYGSRDRMLDAHLMVFFLPQENLLRGGVDFSYIDHNPAGDDGFNARLFIGVPFSLGH